MRWAWLLLLAGCQQIFGLSEPTAIDAAAGDAPPGGIDASPDAGNNNLLACMPLTSLIACYDFNDDAQDSSAMPNVTTTTAISFTPGLQGSAVAVSASSRIKIDDSANLDTGRVSLEAWIMAEQLPATGTRMGVWDTDGQYGMFILPGGVLQCTGGAQVTSTAAITPGVWTHLACVADGTMLSAYINGHVVAAVAGTALSTLPTTGAEIAGNAPDGADRFVGKIDLLRVYRGVRTADQICTDALCTP